MRIIDDLQIYEMCDLHTMPMPELSTVSKKVGKVYLNDFITYDIETTTLVKDKIGFMYIWQMSVFGNILIGRTWNEFKETLQYIKSIYIHDNNTKIVIYVFNLAFEFQFFRQFLQIDYVFARSIRKPIYVISDCFEFRCAYMLTNMSLEKFCESENTVHRKLKGDLDYKVMRTPSTYMSDKNLRYCIYDVVGFREAIISLMRSENDTLATIPLTSTGYVRRDYRKVMYDYNRDEFTIAKPSLGCYKAMREYFRGGDVHANRFAVDVIIDDVVSYDRKSSYPAVMLNGYYPVGKEKHMDSIDIDTYYKLADSKCILAKFDIANISTDSVNPYIDIAHLKKAKGITNDNGRVLKADYGEIYLTEIDIQIIEKEYTLDILAISDVYIWDRGKLPLPIRKKLLDMFYQKEMLKDGDEYFYNKYKNKINASFGCMVSDIARDDIIYNGIWDSHKLSDMEIDVQISKYYKSRNNFLHYQHGIYITAHARMELKKAELICGDKLIYNDTDSVKFIRDSDIIDKINNLNRHIIQDCIKNGAYIDIGNKRIYLGVWELDAEYTKFKTLGSKKYAYVKDGKFDITVSGIPKYYIDGKGNKHYISQEIINDFDKFEYDRQYDFVGKNTLVYDDSDIHIINVYGEDIETGSSCAVINAPYCFTLSGDYEWLLNNLYM